MNLPAGLYQVVFSFKYDSQPGYIAALYDIVQSEGLCQETCKFNTLRPRQNGRHFSEDNLKWTHICGTRGIWFRFSLFCRRKSGYRSRISSHIFADLAIGILNNFNNSFWEISRLWNLLFLNIISWGCRSRTLHCFKKITGAQEWGSISKQWWPSSPTHMGATRPWRSGAFYSHLVAGCVFLNVVLRDSLFRHIIINVHEIFSLAIMSLDNLSGCSNHSLLKNTVFCNNFCSQFRLFTALTYRHIIFYACVYLCRYRGFLVVWLYQPGQLWISRLEWWSSSLVLEDQRRWDELYHNVGDLLALSRKMDHVWVFQYKTHHNSDTREAIFIDK